MPSDCFSFQESGYFTQLITDYLNRDPRVSHLYQEFPDIEGFSRQISEKSTSFSSENRQVLVESLRRQYENTDASLATRQNLESLADADTFTVVTGHQLNLFTGPLYFLYKIVTAINLASRLKQEFPQQHFVPVYWMATEDHDFEEISFFNFHGKKFRWNRESSGAVGRLSTDGLGDLLRIFEIELGPSDAAKEIAALFRSAYLENSTLTEATRWLANKLFAEYGLVIVDGDDQDLKRLFIPYAQEDLLEQTAFAKVSETISGMGDYTVQVNPREINLFYLKDEIRERIVEENDGYRVVGTNISFTKTQILDELAAYPERFSPNVILRPLYQEVVLPNLCYIGGGGEIAYWLELKSFFESQEIPLPILMVRNSVVMASEKQDKKRRHLDLSWKDLFRKRYDLENVMAEKLSEFPIDLSDLKQTLKNQFAHLHSLSEKTDRSFSGAVKAQESKQLKGLENLEKRLLKAQKRKLSDHIERATLLQEELFPGGGLQERKLNFSAIYTDMGSQLIPTLIDRIDPLNPAFVIVVY